MDLAREVLIATERLPQTQASLDDQLKALWLAANKLGLYDAADWLRDAARLEKS